MCAPPPVSCPVQKERARYLAEKIAVDPARGSGHAWGAVMKGQRSRLRTRIPEQGMDYKGYNIAIHEFGQIIEFQLDNYLTGRDFAAEVSRIFKQGRLTPNIRIKQATGNDLLVEPMLQATRKAIE